MSVPVDETSSKVEPQAGSPNSREVRELLRLLVKTRKALRLYQKGSTVPNRLQADLFARLSDYLEKSGPLALDISEFQLRLDEEIVYENNDHKDSLAFLFFRDGVYRISLNSGLEEEELHGLLSCINRVAALANEQDDLVTLFWEQEFKAIDYYVKDEMSSEGGSSLEEQLIPSATQDQQTERDTADSVRIDDLEQPVSFLPTEAVRLSESEIQAVHADLGDPRSQPFHLVLVELTIQLTLLETSEKERANLAGTFITIVDQLLQEGDVDAVADTVEHLSDLMEALAVGPIRQLRTNLLRSLAEPDRVTQFLEQVERDGSMEPAKLTTHLIRLGASSLAIVPYMGRMSIAFRRAVSDAVLTAGERAVLDFSRHLRAGGNADPTFLREVLYVLERLQEESALPLLKELLSSSDAFVRRRAASMLSRFQVDGVDEICLHLLQTADPEIRSAALDTLVRHGRNDLARPILERALGSRDFDQRGMTEKKRTFGAVAELGGDEALEWFVEVLSPKERQWFASRKEIEVKRAAAYGVRMVGSEKSVEILRHLAERGDRIVRIACAKELSEA